MTYSMKLKEEICSNSISRNDIFPELSAIIRYDAFIQENGFSLTFENASIARRVYKDIKSLFNLSVHITVRNQKRFRNKQIYILEVKDHAPMILERLNIKRQDFKTTFFRVEEDKVHNESLKTYELKGYKYVYGAKLALKYDMKKLEEIILNTAKLGDFVSYRINFTLKDRNAADSELLAGAYKNAEIQADSIAKVAGLQISKCLKTSFQPLERDFYSRNAYESSRASVQFAKNADFQNIFIPEDIEVEREIYCIFLAE